MELLYYRQLRYFFPRLLRCSLAPRRKSIQAYIVGWADLSQRMRIMERFSSRTEKRAFSAHVVKGFQTYRGWEESLLHPLLD